ncbi:hypothetical protein BJY04DRAFT_201373 [Aspergillus karnatakaensis]|uniref:DUF3176 domain-containing protein n=1 Tax=Aspergillus karnatakaensis TaxID=1810916 RepID=UPI003CCDA729
MSGRHDLPASSYPRRDYSLPDSVKPSFTTTTTTTTQTTDGKSENSQSNDISIRPATSTLWQKYNDWFVWEFSAIALSAAVLIALVVILTQYDEKPQPSWGYMSLNSLISWLSTVAKACIIVSCSEALGQLKWVWFSQKSRPIEELRTFDAASRGAYGALELAWKLRARHFAVFGTLGLTLALAIDPFAQNLVRYYQEVVIDSTQNAYVGRSFDFDRYEIGVSIVANGVDPSLKWAVYSAILSDDPTTPWSTPRYSCPSGNCTWDPVVSLEAQALCSDVTSQLVTNCTVIRSEERGLDGERNCSVGLPGSTRHGYYIPINEFWSEFRGFVMGNIASDNATVYENTTGLVYQFIAPDIKVKEGFAQQVPTNTTWSATECALEPIVRSFRPSVERLTYKEDTLAVWNKLENRTGTEPYLLKPPWGAEMGMTPGQNFTYSFLANVATGQFLDAILAGSFLRSMRQTFYADGTNADMYAAKDIIEAIGNSNMMFCDDQLANRLNCTMHNIAKAFTKTFRDQGYDADGLNSTTMIGGRVMANATYIAVRWQWLALPVFVWVLALVTLVGTMWKAHTRGVPRWKNDPLPMLFLFRDTILDRPGRGVPAGGNRQVEQTKVRLYEDDGNNVLA